jgi:type IX secretion system PorP/SprF family membrane protein
MRKSIYISILLMITGALPAQQLPFMEGYNINPYGLLPAYAGIHNGNTVFLDYRSDWSGIEGGPTTYQISYSNKFFKRVGLGGRFIYDKTDIFKQTLLLGTYSYEIRIAEKHLINLGLSAGLYKNSIDLAKYFNNPDYVADAALVSGLEKSRIKFISDLSALYRVGNFESGILFSNLMFGSAKYNNVELSYKPFNNYMAEVAYDFPVSDRWNVKPFVLWRGGQHVPGLLETAATVTYSKRVWVTALFRSAGIWGFGAGAQIFDGVLVNYSYNLSTNVAMNIFGSHQVTFGFRLFKPPVKEKPLPPLQMNTETPVMEEVAKVTGTVARRADYKQVPGIITVFENNKEVQKTAVKGDTFNLELRSGKTYRFELSSDNYQTATQTIEIPANTRIRELKFIVDYKPVVMGTVTDQSTQDPVNSTILVSENGVDEQTISAKGDYNIKLQKDAVYQFEFKSDGYFSKKMTTDMTTQDIAQLNVQLQKIKEESFELKQINFETGKSVITSVSLPYLDAFITVLKDNPTLKFEISGYTDNVGSPEINKRISMERAQACVNYMISKGISPDRLKPAGYGQDSPLVPNNTPENRAKNRRVEAKIIR